jgi:excisionase family DNA binding protein
MIEKLFSVQEIARITGWSPFTIYKKASAGEIPGRLKIGKGSLRFRASEVEDWLLGKNPAVDGELRAGGAVEGGNS